MPLTPKQKRFIAEYAKDLNATQAATRAGYSKKTAAQIGERLLRNVEIAAAVQQKESAQLAGLDITAERVKLEIARVAFANPKAFFDAKTRLPRSLDELSDDEAAAIAQLDVALANLDPGDGKRDPVLKIRFVDKMRALELLAKHFGIAKEQIEVTGLKDLVDRLTRARQRVDGKGKK